MQLEPPGNAAPDEPTSELPRPPDKPAPDDPGEETTMLTEAPADAFDDDSPTQTRLGRR